MTISDFFDSGYEHIEKRKRVITVWGEGRREFPYEKNRYHIGQLTTALLMVDLINRGMKTSVLLTSDSAPRQTGEVDTSLFNKQVNNLSDWLKRVCGAQIEINDVNTIKDNIDAKISNFWLSAQKKMHDLIRDFEIILKAGNIRIDIILKNQCKEFIQDDMPAKIFNLLPKTLFNEIQKIVADHSLVSEDDLYSTFYLLMIKKPNWLTTQWPYELGSVVSAHFNNAVIVEAKRNLYWLRFFRFLHSITRNDDSVLFPDIAVLKNILDNNNSAMTSEKPDTAVFIFDTNKTLEEKLNKFSSESLIIINSRIAIGKVKHNFIPSLPTLPDPTKNHANVNILMEIICYFRCLWNTADNSNLCFDNWFCAKYLTEVMIEKDILFRSQENISPIVTDDPNSNIIKYQNLLVHLINYRLIKSTDNDIKYVINPLNKIISNAKNIDILLHMSAKRYRDHAIHQIHVAVIGYILLNSVAPKKVKDGPNTLFLKYKKSTDLNSLYITSALIHDHGYPLLQAAWLNAKLFQLYPTASDKIAEELSTSISPFIKEYSSKWFMSIIENIKILKKSDPLKISEWDEQQRNRAASLFDVPENSLDKYPSHGLISAINFWQLMEEEKDSPQDLKRKHPWLFKMLQAVAQHDSDFKISFSDNVLAFLLILADELQEWHRIIYCEGDISIENYSMILRNMELIDKDNNLWQLPEELVADFQYLGSAKSKAPWDYSLFKKSKLKNLNRLNWPKDPSIFSTEFGFSTTIGPEHINHD